MSMERKGADLLKSLRDINHHNEYLNKENKNLEEMVKTLDKNLEQVIVQSIQDKKKLENTLIAKKLELKTLKEKLKKPSLVIFF